MTKKRIAIIAATLAALLLPGPSFSAAGTDACATADEKCLEKGAVESGFDWRGFLGEHDMLWDNDVTADPVFPEGVQGKRHWGRTDGYYSGALMGNGLLGTNLYKLSDGVYRLNVGRSDVTEAREPFSLYNSGRLPIGYFTFSTVGQVQDEKMRLSIYDATTSGALKTDVGELDFRTYVHSERECIVFDTRTEGGESGWKLNFIPQKAISPRYVFNCSNVPKGYVNSQGKSNPDPYFRRDGDISMSIQPLAKDTTFTDIARWYVVAWKTVTDGPDSRTIATVAQSAKLETAVREAKSVIRKAFAVPKEKLDSEHLGWWHKFYEQAAFLTFPDKDIERFYWFQYYKFASTARPGKPVVDLQGVWPTCDTPWPAIWMNLNIQLTYSWLTKANLGFLERPLWDALWKNRDNLTRNVTDIRGQEDWTECRVLPRASGYDFHAPLNPALAQRNQYEVGNLTWTLFYYWQMCEAYGDDIQMKARLFPLLKSAVNIFFRIRIQNPDGTYSLPSTASPEYGEGDLGEIGTNTNYDLANLRWGLSTLIEIDGKYGLNDPMLPQWKDFLAKMPSFRYDENTGFKISDKFEFLDTTHRHWSHLFMIYPYHLLDWDNPLDAERMTLSLRRWQGNTGYSLTGKAAMLASHGEGNAALECLKRFLAGWVRPNTLYNESGPVIETPFSAMCSLEELYMQDWGDRIRVFHGCPSSWKDVSFRNMRARGAFLVSAVRKGGNTSCVRVISEKGGTCRIQTGIPEMMLIVTGEDGNIPQWRALGGGVVEIFMKKGETVTLTRRLLSYNVNYDESKVPEYVLPDPLVEKNGRRVKSVRDWENKRRPEIMDMLRKEMYGYEPGKPSGLHFKVLEESRDAFGGKATRRQVAVYFTEDESRFMTLLMYVPNGANGPVPAFMGMNFRGNYATTTDPEVLMPTEGQLADYGAWYQPVGRGDWGRRWPYEYVLSRGYAVVTMFYGDADPDWNDGFRNGVHGLIDAGKPRKADSWGTVSAWAWGLSRALDYLETDSDIDASRVAVLGHSRLGKTALWAGATDPRFALVISNCSGCCGAALSRRKFGETPYIINDAFPHWFCGNFRKYSNNEDALPFDQHELVSMIAPRPVYISSASEDNWADQKGEYLSLVGAAPVYALYGIDGFTDTAKPAVENPRVCGRMGNHMRRGDHDILLYDWTQFVNFADMFLK